MSRTRAVTAILALVLAAGSSSPIAFAAPAMPLTLEDFRGVVSISDVAASPTTPVVAYVTHENDYDRDESYSTLHLLSEATGNSATLSRRGEDASSPRWAPSGRALAYLAKPGHAAAKPGVDDPALDRPQIAVVETGSFSPVYVTHEKRGVQDFAWSPDGKTFGYLTSDEAPNHKAIEAHDDAFEVHDNQWTTQSEAVPTHLWTIPASGGTAHRVTSGAFSLRGAMAFAPDGKSILLTRFPSAFTQHYLEQRLVRVNLASGDVRPIVADAPAGDPVFAASDGDLAYLRPNPASPSIEDAIVARSDGSGARDVTRAHDRAVLSVRFAPDGTSIFALVHDGARSRIVETDGATFTRDVALGSLNPSSFDAGPAHDVVFVASSPGAPSELYQWLPGAAPRRLTHYNVALARHAIAPSVAISWKGAGGFTDDGVVTLPLGVPAGTRAPLVLVIHGGPTASSTTSFSEIPQLLAARGYYVFQPNYRGSDNLGAAFAQATIPHISSAPGQDCEDGLAAVLARYPIDASRIGVSGWSEGGLMTSWLITHDTRWKAAMSGAGVDDWLMYHDLTDSQDFTPLFMSATPPWTDDKVRAFFREESPLTYADRVKTPTLIMTDAGDQRVPEPISFAFYHAIRATGTPVTLVVIPADGHFPDDPVRSEDVIRRWVDWFAKSL